MKRTVLALLLSALLSLPAFAAQNSDKVSMDFVNVDIAVVVKYISELTGKNFVIDEKVQGKVTIISPRKVTKREAYRVFESILEVYGFTAMQTGKVTKIVPIAEARQKGGDVETGPAVSREIRDKMVTQLIPLKSVSADELVKVIRPLIPPTSYVAAYSPTNTLILVDLAANRTRILSIVEKLDVEGVESLITVLHLKYASAKDIARKIDAVLGKKAGVKGAQKRTRFNIIADDRINALIIVGNDYHVKKVKSLIAQLDVEAPPGRQEINVIYLKNADAEKLAKVVNNIARSTAGLSAAKGRTPPKTGSAGKTVVTADKSTNSLIITSAPEDFITLKNVIEKLDIPRRQVFVEALIFEVSSTDSEKFGIEWRTTSNFTESGVQGIGGTNFGAINSVSANPFSAGNGLTIGVVDGVIGFAGQTFANIGGLVQALQTEEGINILSTPNLLTMDNEEAEIFVGENVPFIKSTAQTTGATPIQNIERKDVGINLKIKPQINESDFVKLEIYQEISSLRPALIEGAQDISTFKRSADTTVTVKDGQNIVIGGLIREDFQDTIQKVPLLGDIPILGWLFKSKEKKRVKTNLLIFLTPHIINNHEDLEKITNKKMKMKDSMEKQIAPGGKNDESDGAEIEPENSGTLSAPEPADERKDAESEPEEYYGEEITIFQAPDAVAFRSAPVRRPIR